MRGARGAVVRQLDLNGQSALMTLQEITFPSACTPASVREARFHPIFAGVSALLASMMPSTLASAAMTALSTAAMDTQGGSIRGSRNKNRCRNSAQPYFDVRD